MTRDFPQIKSTLNWITLFTFAMHPFLIIRITTYNSSGSYSASGHLMLKALLWASLVAQTVKRLPALWETRVWSLGWEDPLEKEKAILVPWRRKYCILTWKIPCMEELVVYSPRGHKESQKTERLHSLYMHYLIWCNKQCTTRQYR